jgi:hypothetical protein
MDFTTEDLELWEKEFVGEDIKKNRLNLEIDGFSDLISEEDAIKKGIALKIEHELKNFLLEKFPFLKLDDFITNYFDGEMKSVIVKKFQLRGNSSVLDIRKKIELPKRQEMTKMGQNRLITSNNNISKNQETFERFSEIVKINANKINQVLFKNISRANIIIAILSEFKTKNEIKEFRIEDCKYFSYLINQNLEISDIEKFYDKNFDDVFIELIESGFINENNNLFSLNSQFKKFKELETFLLNVISQNQLGITYEELLKKVENEFSVITILPHISIFENILNELESQKKIVINSKKHAKYGITENQFFTINNFQKTTEKINESFELRKEFYGRDNDDAITFVYEIKKLAKGELDDNDDQINRIAGLVLTTNQTLITSKNTDPFFDFSTKISNFVPTEEEMKIMKDIDFEIRPSSEFMHVKILISEKITPKDISKIKEILNSPIGQNSQVIIISFENNSQIKKIIPNDKSIQIVDEISFKKWVEITPIIPSRINSLVQIMRGGDFKKLAIVKNIFFDTGLAVIEFIDDLETERITISDIKEMKIFDNNDDYKLMYENLVKFLKLLGTKTDLFLVQNAMYQYNDDPTNEIIDYMHSKNDIENDSKIIADVGLNKITIIPSDIHRKFHCNCIEFDEKKFCEHLVLILIDIVITNEILTRESFDEQPIMEMIENHWK